MPALRTPATATDCTTTYMGSRRMPHLPSRASSDAAPRTVARTELAVGTNNMATALQIGRLRLQLT